MKAERSVLAILPMGNGMAQAALSGIRAEATRHRWHVLCAETERASDGSLRIERSSGSVASVGELAALMRPDGVIVANDKTGEEVLDVCSSLNIAVPQDISVVGVDNMVYLCESTSPALSSIVMNHVQEGRAAAQLLDGWMESPNHRPPPSRSVPALRLVRRASSRAPCDRRVAKALEYIRLGACGEGFSPRDVVAQMGVSRSHGFALFKSVTGHTILDEIQSVRLERAKELLRQGRRADLVASDCGFASHDDFRRVFRKRCGMSVKAWKAVPALGAMVSHG